jgi:hypothetical protein
MIRDDAATPLALTEVPTLMPVAAAFKVTVSMAVVTKVKLSTVVALFKPTVSTSDEPVSSANLMFKVAS